MYDDFQIGEDTTKKRDMGDQLPCAMPSSLLQKALSHQVLELRKILLSYGMLCKDP